MGSTSPRTSIQLISSFGIGLSVSCLLVAWFGTTWPDPRVLTACVGFGVIAALVPRWVLRKPCKLGDAVVSFVLTTVIVSSLSAWWLVALSLTARPFGSLAELIVFSAPGLVVGAIFGAGLSVVFLPLFTGTIRLSERQTHDSADRMTRRVAMTLLCLALLLGMVMGLTRATPSARACGIVLLTAGVLLLAYASVRLKLRARWRKRVLAHLDSGWIPVPVAELTMDLSGPIPLTKADLDYNGVIMKRSSEPRSGAYRTGENKEPYALVKLPASA